MYMEADEQFMDLALSESEKAMAAGEIPVGAVVVSAGTVVGRGYNRPISASDSTAHAEMLAIREAARVLGNYRLPEVTLYCTVEPCIMCAGAMIHARISRLVFGTPDPKAGAAGSIYNVLTDPRLNHRVEVVSGICEDRCAAILRTFFASRRT
jgi:tRNA(adenine34) deaminase